VKPPRGGGRRGVLATRSPHRPNPIGLSAVELLGVEPGALRVRGLDLLDGTPVLDVKPYVPYTDAFPDSGHGWLAADPRPEWSVSFSMRAEEQLGWIAARLPLPLRERVEATLKLGPQPHPYRRIRRGADGLLQLAVQEWRIDFRVEGQKAEVLGVRTGYRASQLAKAPVGDDDPVQLHRQFVALFG
jgi:hypothetical protein